MQKIRKLAEEIIRLTEKSEVRELASQIINICQMQEYGLPEFLLSCEGIDIEESIEQNGSPDGLLQSMAVFVRRAPELLRMLCEDMEAENLENLSRTAHTLKSSARAIGAMTLSEMAKETEEGARENDPAALGLAEDLSVELERIGNSLLPLLDRTPRTGVEIDKESLKQLYSHMLRYVEDYNDEAVGSMLKALDAYDFPGEEQERFEQIKIAFDTVDWVRMQNLLEELVNGNV